MKNLLEKFFHCYLAERNLEATLEFLTDHIISIGTGEHEIARGKTELRSLLECEFKELPNPLKYEIYNFTEIKEADNVWNLFANLRVWMEHEDGEPEMQSRFTCTCIRRNSEWKISSLHMSTPAQEQEENSFFPLHYGKKAIGKMSSDSSEKLLELISEVLPGGIMGGYLEKGFPMYIINDKMLDILGYSYEELIAATDEKMLNTIYIDDRARVEKGIYEQFEKKNEYEIEYRAVAKNNRLIWVNDIGKKIITKDGREAMISIMTDITERKERETQLCNYAERDSLTYLYNRRKAMSLIEEELVQNNKGILFICDIDNFKNINDTRGHVVGDKVLVQLASIMQKQAGEASIIGRLGGDEYILFFPEKVAQDDVVKLMRVIQKEFIDYMRELAPELNVSLSIGGTVRSATEDVEALYVKADAALYRAKQKKGEYFESLVLDQASDLA